MAVNASTIASIAPTYIPPFASFTPTQSVISSSSSGAPAPTRISHDPNPTVPAIADPSQWIAAYLDVHRLTPGSYRYAYLLWITILFFGLVCAFMHWTGFRGGFVGAWFNKWAIRRRTWRKREAGPHRQPLSFPSNAQLLALFFLFVGPVALCVAGPDYIAPSTKVWDLAHNITRRDDTSSSSLPALYPPQFTIQKAWWTSGNRLGLIAFSLFPLSVLLALKAPPFALFALPLLTSLHFDKLTRLHKWCGRLIWLLVAGHVATWSIQLARDTQQGVSGKSAWSFVLLYPDFIHAIIAFASLTLLVLLSVGPIRERFYETFHILHILLVPTTLVFSALHYPPLGPWCYVALGLWAAERAWRFGKTAWINGAFGAAREVVQGARYEPPGESGRLRKAAPADWNARPRGEKRSSSSSTERERPLPPPPPSEFPHAYPPPNANYPPSTANYPPHRHRPTSVDSFAESISDYYRYEAHHQPYDTQTPRSAEPTGLGSANASPGSSVDLMPNQALSHSRQTSFDRAPAPAPPSRPAAPKRSSPPAGYAHAVALPGRTVRLTIQTSRPLAWAPGQHVLLSVPAVSRLTTHPFTIASVCDKQARNDVVLLIRARKGFTKALWALVQRRSAARTRALSETLFSAAGRPRRGVLVRASVDGPFGSSERARWGLHSTVVIVVGGSGVSFGSSIMEYVCMCMTGREGRSLGGKGRSFRTERVRFVWVVREYAHIQWCAPIIRRCLDMVPRSALQVDIFVTNGTSKGILGTSLSARPDLRAMMTSQSEVFADDDATLAPPVARFAKEGKPRSLSNSSLDSLDSAGNMSTDSLADLNYASDDGGRPAVTPSPEPEGHILDMTNFDGEDDTRLPGEAQLSHTVRKEGRVRRAISRRVAAGAPVARTFGKAGAKLTPLPPTPEGQTPLGDSPPALASPPIIAPPSSYRPPQQSYRPPPSSYQPPPPSRPAYNRAASPSSSDDGRGAYSSADYYASGGDPLHSPPPSTVRVPAAPTVVPVPPTPPELYVSDDWRAGEPVISPSYESLPQPQQYKRPWDDYNTTLTNSRPPNAKRGSAQSSLYTVGGPAQLSYFGSDPNFDARMMGVGESSRSLVDRYGRPHQQQQQQQQRPGDAQDEPPVEMDEDEAEDLNVVSEMARPGRPKLDRILADEVERSHGSVAVACCGPTSLNATVRKIVAGQISPSRLLRGDKRGQVTLITEDFEW